MPTQDLFNFVIREGLGYCISEGRRGGRRVIVLAVAGMLFLGALCAGIYCSGFTRCRQWWGAMSRVWGEPPDLPENDFDEVLVEPLSPDGERVQIMILQDPPIIVNGLAALGSQNEVSSDVLEDLDAQMQNINRLLASAATLRS